MNNKIKCPWCYNEICVSQPDNHSEYVPTGKCQNCGLRVMVKNHYSKKLAKIVIINEKDGQQG